MKKTLHQKGFFFKQNWFEITDVGISIKTKKLNDSDEFSLLYEDIGTKIIKSKKGKKGWLIGTIVCMILSIGMFILEKTGGDAEKSAYIVYLSLGLVCAVVYLITYERFFYLANNENANAIPFLIDKPSKQELDAFIFLLKKERKDYLLSKYAQLTKHITYEQQYNTLGWLNRIDVLSKEEYNSKVVELNNLFSGTNSIIGFHNRNK